MKQLLKWLGFVVMGSQLFLFSIPILNMTVAGYTIKFLLYYLMIFAVNFLWILKKFYHGKMTLTELGVAMLVVGPIMIGMVWGWSLRSVLLDTVHMIMPIVVYQWIDLTSVKREGFIKFFAWISIVSAAVSVLVALGMIDAGIWAEEGDYVRSAGAVDSTVGIMAVCIAMVGLYIYPEEMKKYKNLQVAMLISGIVTTVFSQSRTRIALLAVVVGIVFLYNIFNRKSKAGTLRLLFLVGLVTAVVMISFSNVAEQILAQILERFEKTGASDGNIIYRQQESKVQMNHFWQSPILGKGYGSISSQKNMYFHNIYSALLMQGGLLFGGVYIVWLVSYLVRAIGRMLRREEQGSAMVCLLVISVLLVLGYTNGGILQSGGYCAAAYIFADDKMRRKKALSRPYKDICVSEY